MQRDPEKSSSSCCAQRWRVAPAGERPRRRHPLFVPRVSLCSIQAHVSISAPSASGYAGRFPGSRPGMGAGWRGPMLELGLVLQPGRMGPDPARRLAPKRRHVRDSALAFLSPSPLLASCDRLGNVPGLESCRRKGAGEAAQSERRAVCLSVRPSVTPVCPSRHSQLSLFSYACPSAESVSRSPAYPAVLSLSISISPALATRPLSPPLFSDPHRVTDSQIRRPAAILVPSWAQPLPSSGHGPALQEFLLELFKTTSSLGFALAGGGVSTCTPGSCSRG